jgi:oxalate decarboxylase/phosphoglucose isomerase-like protein (cupin superfamily)
VWLEKRPSTTTPLLRCEQHAGDILFVPDGWSHMTLNQAESIGYASEFEFINAVV